MNVILRRKVVRSIVIKKCIHVYMCILYNKLFESYTRIQRIVQCTMYSVQCTVYNVQCTMYSVQCTVYNIQCTMYSVQCTVYNVQCILKCTVHWYLMYNIQCTLYY